MLLIVLVVLFTMTMFVWLLLLLGAVGSPPSQPVGGHSWLAWFASLILGIVVFLVGFGAIVVQHQVPLR